LWLGSGILWLGARLDLAMFGCNTGDDFIDLVTGAAWVLGGFSLICFFRFEWAWRKVAVIEAVYEAASGVSALPPDAVFSMLRQKQQWKLLWIPASSMVAGMVLSVLQGSLWQWGLRISFLDRFWLEGWVLILASFLYLIGAILHLLKDFRHLPAGVRRLLNGTQAEREAARARAAPEFLRFELIHAYASSPGFGIGRRILGCVLLTLFVLAVYFVDGVRDAVRDVSELSISP